MYHKIDRELILTVEPVAITRISYLKVSLSALTKVFEARSALTISVLRIKVIPVRIYFFHLLLRKY